MLSYNTYGQEPMEERYQHTEAEHLASLGKRYIQNPLIELSLFTKEGFDTGIPCQDNGVFLSTFKARYNRAHIGAIFSIIQSLLDTQDVFVQKPQEATLESRISKAEARVEEAKSKRLIPVTMRHHVAVAVSRKVLSVSREELGLRRMLQQRESIEAMNNDIDFLKYDIGLWDDAINAKKKDLSRIYDQVDRHDPSDGAGRLQEMRESMRETIKKMEEDKTAKRLQENTLQGLEGRLKSDREAVGLFELINLIYFSTQTAARIKRAIDTSLDTKALEEYEDSDLDFNRKESRAEIESGIDANTLNEYENYFRDLKPEESHEGIDIETLVENEDHSQTCRPKKKTMAVEAPPADEQQPPLKREAPPADEQRAPLEHWINEGESLCAEISSMKYFIGKER